MNLKQLVVENFNIAHFEYPYNGLGKYSNFDDWKQQVLGGPQRNNPTDNNKDDGIFFVAEKVGDRDGGAGGPEPYHQNGFFALRWEGVV